MDYKSYQAQDFIGDKKFRRWIYKPDHDLNLYWEEFIQKHPEKISEIQEAKKILENISDYRFHINDEKSENLWKKIRSEAFSSPEKSNRKVVELNSSTVIHKYKKQPRTSNNHFLKIAAAVTFLLVAASMFFLLNNRESPELSQQEELPVWIEKSNPWGQKSTVFLSDGSEVKLNAGSTIRYQRNFTPEERRIFLTGEAYFKVKKDTLRPFRVQSGDFITQALGTAFNIDAYQANSQLQISLVEGKVSVKSEKIEQDYLLTPGESVRYANQKVEKLKFDHKNVLAWTDGILIFENASQKAVFNKLQQWYGVSFTFEDQSSKPWSYTAEFNNKSLENVLLTIGFTMDFEFEISNDNVIINYN